jgi:transitional endoplasmic reticulum ATPase
VTDRSKQHETLREAIRLSPDNVPLRQHLAEMLLTDGEFAAAEAEYRQALSLAPTNNDLKVGLARCYYSQNKDSLALVIIEDLVDQSRPPAAACLLHARLLFRGGEVSQAVSRYRQAIDVDPDVADDDFADLLGIDAVEEESEVSDGRVRVGDSSAGATPSFQFDKPEINFDNVGGMEAVKEQIRLKIIYPLEHAEIYKAYGKSIGGGILMYGPPGCGKTLLARATAGQISSRFLSIGINDVLEMWLGNSERNLHEVFETARRNTPCVLFFDEVDALGASRSDMRQSAGRHLINQFLAELDGAKSSNEGVLVLGATNAPWHLDSAFRRPGRFDQVLFIPPPDDPARAEILSILCRGKPVQDVDYLHVARKAAGFSGADLKAVVDTAIEAKLGEAMKTGRPLPISTKDLVAAVKSVRPSTDEWFSTARNHALYSNQGGAYDEILKYLNIK